MSFLELTHRYHEIQCKVFLIKHEISKIVESGGEPPRVMSHSARGTWPFSAVTGVTVAEMFKEVWRYTT